MSTEPPPDAVILGLSGLAGPQDQAAVHAAILRCDPAARIWTDRASGRVAVASAAPVAALRAAVQAAGYGAEVQRGAPGQRASVAGVFGRVLLWAVLGCVAGVVVGAGLGMANSLFNPDCTRPGSSGNCAIGVGVFGLLLGALGIPAGAVVGLVLGLARRR
jgi:hypothetical protein